MRFLIPLLLSVFITGEIAAETFLPRGMKLAAGHGIVMNRPAPGFFDGALLGNGAMGIVVTTRPDAVWLHFGHNNVWDIRITENHQDEFGTFSEIFARADSLSDDLPSIYHDADMAEYLSMTADNYRSPYPRPFPCGSLILGFDRRKVELTGHELDITKGICKINLLIDGQPCILKIFANMQADEAWLALYDAQGRPMASCFDRIRLMPDPSTPGDIPPYSELDLGDSALGFSQTLPFSLENPDASKDHAFSLIASCAQKLTAGTRMNTLGQQVALQAMERYIRKDDTPFVVRVGLKEGLSPLVTEASRMAPAASEEEMAVCSAVADSLWRDYWQASAVELADKELERIWYRNLYFLNCSLKPGVTPPGIFGNWSYGNIGTSWHGDYHLNYNTQQPYWVTFSTNHLDKNLVYADMVDNLLPVSRKWAKEYYGMRGAFFPHSAYPVEMHTHPYPVPDWGWEVFETPWIVQGLWWHYIYSGDKDFLRKRAFAPMRDAVMFLVDYMKRDDAHGQPRWNDELYHIFPSVPPELYGLQPGFKFNHDTQIDLALARFVFDAYLQAVEILGVRNQEKETVKDVRHLLRHMPDYSTCESAEYGRILTSVPGEEEGIIYNVPAPLAVVFPGEQYGIASPDSIKTLIVNTISAHQNEGGNDIVFLPLQKARMGMLDLAQFKRLVNYATLPNGTVTDAVTQIGGRYSDNTDYMYMAPMGIWIENFALPAVINECMMQSYDGNIRLFPNWDSTTAGNARFSTLRARGGFLVSAAMTDGAVGDFEILSTVGGVCRIINPWPGHALKADTKIQPRLIDEMADIWEIPTDRGTTYHISAE